MAAELVEAMNMVKSFRVSDLQTLLTSMGRSKSGLKQDLVGRALRLVQTEYSPELLKNIRQLYDSRFPKAAQTTWVPQRRPDGLTGSFPGHASPPTSGIHGTDYLNGLARTAPAPASEVKLASLPFYQTLEMLMAPTELVAQNGEKLQDTTCSFELTQSQVEQIRSSREIRPGMKSIQVVLRICYADTVSLQEDQYPPNIAVKVNQSFCHVPGYYPSNKPGVEPRRPCRPINLTPWLHLTTGTNRLTVTWGNFGKRYCVALYLVRVFTSAELFSQLKHHSVESAERCRERIQEKLRFDPESEIATTGLRVSLICPLVKMRLNVPCRVLTCAHLQCFDAVFFLQMNEKKPTWTCPVCDKPAPFGLLAIDGLLSEILKQTEEDVEEIEYLADGSWRPIRDEKEKEKDRSSSPECPLLDICAGEPNGHTPVPKPTLVGVAVPGGVPPVAGAANSSVVDLTLDSSSEEEEEQGGGAGDSEDTEDSQDSPPPKKGRYNYDKDLVTAY